jgi:cytoskeleton protein RodZ
MAQDKVAEIIKFTGAGAPPAEAPARAETPPLPGDAETAGALLAAARAAAGLSIDAVSEAIKVKAGHIAAIEAMRADILPPLPYVSGFVKTYARYLGLDAEALAARFRAEIAGAAEPAETEKPETPKSEAAAEREGARLVSVFAILIIVLFVLWVIVQVLSGAGKAPAPAAPAPIAAAPAETQAPAPAEPAAEAAPEIVQPADQAPAEPADAQAAESAPEETVADAPAPEAAAEERPAPPVPTLSQPQEAPAPQARETAPPLAAVSEPPAREELLPRRPRPSPPSRAPEVVEAKLDRTVAPDYPDRCSRGARDLEAVTVMFDVSAAGRAVNTRIVSSTNACFNEEALRALARWRFAPRTVDGAASVEAGKSATLNFRK